MRIWLKSKSDDDKQKQTTEKKSLLNRIIAINLYRLVLRSDTNFCRRTSIRTFADRLWNQSKDSFNFKL